jgi:hypothetical protein
LNGAPVRCVRAGLFENGHLHALGVARCRGDEPRQTPACHQHPQRGLLGDLPLYYRFVNTCK